MDGFEKRKERIKKKIKETAWELFLEDGFEQVSMNQIAQKAEVSKVSIYNFFDSKMGLVEQLLMDYLHLAYTSLQQLIQNAKPFREKLDLFVGWEYNPINKLPRLFYEEEVQRFYFSKDELDSIVQRFLKTSIYPLFHGWIEQGKKEGQISKEFENDSILLYLSAIQPIIQQAYETKQQYDLHLLMLYGLRGKG